jgi:hypothetical protein
MDTYTDPLDFDAQRQRIINEAAYRVRFLSWLALRLETSDDVTYRREAAAVLRWVAEGQQQ